MRHFIFGIAVVLITLIMTSCTTGKGNFSLINKAKEPIIYASVAICGQTIELKNIQPEESKIGSYDVKTDSHYTIEVEFRSGKKLRKEVGYVTNGMDFQHEIMITSSNIEINNK